MRTVRCFCDKCKVELMDLINEPCGVTLVFHRDRHVQYHIELCPKCAHEMKTLLTTIVATHA